MSAVGCAFDWAFPADSSGGTDGGSLDGPTPSDAAPPPAKDGGTGDGSVVRSCTQSSDCAGKMTEYCHFADYSCGKGGATSGVCTAIPNACAANDEVCSCDGRTYPNECLAVAGGLDLSKSGCAYDAGTQFACGPAGGTTTGPHICEQNKEYCLVSSSSPPTYSCKSPPVATGSCPQLSCNCPSIIDLKCTCSGPPGEVQLKNCP